MNVQLAWRRLLWKELRQLLPMLILLPTLVVLLQLFYLTAGDGRLPIAFNVIALLGMPGLFAVGAGALLVGHEKEVRTLAWLASLPIAPSWIVRVKLAAALAGLLVLWLLGLGFFALGQALDYRLPSDIQWLTWPLNSLFVLLAGFALAWWTKSALVALLLVVPVSLVPVLLATAIDSVAPWRASVYPKPSASTLWVCQIVCSGIALWLTDRLGRAALAAESPTAVTLAAWLPGRDRYRSGEQRAGYRKPQAPLSALIWQFVLQSRALLIGTSLMLLVAAVLITTGGLPQGPASLMPLAMLLAFVATSWLGVSVFQSDSAQQRIRFLADRGVSPRSVWFTRHAAPASIVAVFIFLSLLLGVASVERDHLNLGGVATAVALYSLALAVVYLFAHWTGQVIFSPIVSTVAAPFIALGAIGFGSFAVMSLGTPWWLALLVLLIPPVATLCMTRRWMDRRLGFSYWASHTGFFAAVLFLPAIPLLVTAVRQPTMPAETAREINALWLQSQAYLVAPQELVLGAEKPKQVEQVNPPIAGQWDRQLDQIEDQLNATTGPISISSARVLERLRGIAALTRMRLEQTTLPAGQSAVSDDTQAASEDTQADRQQTLQLYRRTIGLLVPITQRMRLSGRLIEQDAADLLEIWLLEELRHPQARERLGDALYRDAAGMLADRAGRSKARGRAVALSWWAFQSESGGEHPPTSLGGYPLRELQTGIGTIRGRLLNNRRVALAVAELWQLVQGGAQAATPQRLAEIARYWGRPASEYGIGPAGDYLRADDLERFVDPGFQLSGGAVASQWYADWERQAAELSAT